MTQSSCSSEFNIFLDWACLVPFPFLCVSSVKKLLFPGAKALVKVSRSCLLLLVHSERVGEETRERVDSKISSLKKTINNFKLNSYASLQILKAKIYIHICQNSGPIL